MKIPFNENIINLANQLTVPLYAVGGYVRNFLIDGTISDDVDICSCVNPEKLYNALKKLGFKIIGEYPRTHTVLFTDGNQKYEFTSMRKDCYTGGGHKPTITEYTDDVIEDARRRDFKCNAIYYDIKLGEIVDPLNGIEDIRLKKLDTVKTPDDVFCNDGLRLMRLARFSGELGFTPTQEVIVSAKKYADNILEIAPERIAEELRKILVCDGKYRFSDKKGHYTALKILDETRVLDRIIPELTKGRGLEQRKDYHKYNVLEHSLKAVLYADKEIRLSALLHDLGKHKQFIENGNFYYHDKIGAELVKLVLQRLKLDNRTIKETAFLTRYHMLDMDLKLKTAKLRKFIVGNYLLLEKLLKLKQADYSACLDDLKTCPTVSKWRIEVKKMKAEGVPFSLKELLVTAQDVVDAGFKGKQIGEVLNWLLNMAILTPKINEKSKLISLLYKYKR